MEINYTCSIDGCFKPLKDSDLEVSKRFENFSFSHLLFYKFSPSYWLVIDTFNNQIALVCNQTKLEVFDKCNEDNKYFNYYAKLFYRNKKTFELQHDEYLQFRRKERLNFYIICPTFDCNSRCIYCYQQYDKSLDRKSISNENLDFILSCIEKNIVEIRSIRKDEKIAIGLFGGEPFMKCNKECIEKIMHFARENQVPVLPTSNLQEVDDFIDIFFKYRGYFERICTTIDGDKEYHNSRRCSLITEDPFKKVVDNINLLISLRINVTVTINIDSTNKGMLKGFLEVAKDNSWIDNDNVTLEIGRVDDRCYTGTSDDIMLEAELLEYLYNFNKINKFPKNIKLAFIKTSLNLAQRFNFAFNQKEPGRGNFHYCWSSTPCDDVQYIDKDGNIYRCTYTVGKSNFIIGNIFEENINRDIFKRSSFIEQCWNCPIGGFCGGGCSVSCYVNKERFCKEEKRNFDYLINNLVIPIIQERIKNDEL